KLAEVVYKRAKLAQKAGCAGVICSGSEIKEIKKRCGPDFLTVVPGIRPDWAEVAGDDQQRVATPQRAIFDGADYLVVGRPIRTAPNPAAAADRIGSDMTSAFSKA
ncbi:MAG TPA: orotidine 5'-phosphate decarboxylase / HUMPS family protein, partial [Nitrospiria bacterium]|nr:orotidine 5'-phosphate decarboxylase / HUMPS family protein [Nitrospiria bacterium]